MYLLFKIFSMRLIVSLLFCSICSFASAQKLFVNTFVGASNYQGDLQVKRFTYSQARLAFGAGVSYEISDKIFIRTGLTLGKVTADDKKYLRNADRNLNFTSHITELQVACEYYINNPYYNSLSP